MSGLIFRSEYHLQADNPHEESGNRVQCHVNLSYSGIQILKLNSELKAIGFRSFLIPHSINDAVWLDYLDAILKSTEFKTECASLNCSYAASTSKVVVLPASLYAQDKTEQYHHFMFGNTDGMSVSEQQLSNAQMIGIQAIPTSVAQLIEKPIASSFLHLVNQIHSESDKTKAHLVLEEREMALVVFKDSELVFCNWFKTDAAEDILYYLMATLETLKILHTDIEVELSGQIEQGDQVHNVLSKYISKLSFRKRPKNLGYSYSFNGLPEHRFPFIFATACE